MRTVLAILTVMIITACAPIVSNCIAVKPLSHEETNQIYMAETKLPENSPLIPILMDWVRMRDEARACK